jgi:hypothetical protein
MYNALLANNLIIALLIWIITLLIFYLMGNSYYLLSVQLITHKITQLDYGRHLLVIGLTVWMISYLRSIWVIYKNSLRWITLMLNWLKKTNCLWLFSMATDLKWTVRGNSLGRERHRLLNRLTFNRFWLVSSLLLLLFTLMFPIPIFTLNKSNQFPYKTHIRIQLLHTFL